MTYLNTSSGLGGLFDQLTSQLDQQAKNNDQLRGLAAGGIVPASAAPPSVLSRLQSMFGFGGDQTPQSPAPQMGGNAPQLPLQNGTTPSPQPPMAFAGPSPPAPATSAPAPTSQQPANVPMLGAPLPTFAAAGGAPGQDNTSRALAFYQSKGLSPLAASALVGGFHAESGSGLNSNSLNKGDGTDGSNSVGIAQWNGARAAGLRSFAAANGLDPSDINTQLEYSWRELNGPEKGTLTALQSAQNPLQATAAAIGYERPAGWSAQNPLGALTFGKRLQSTVALAQNGFSTPFNGQPIGPNPNGFTPQQSAPSLPAMTATGQGMQLSPATRFAQPTAGQGSASAFTDAPTAASAPAQQAIGAATQNDPLVTVPGYAGQWNKARIAAAPDGTDVPDDGELSKAQAITAVPPVSNALPYAATPQQAPMPAAPAPQAGSSQPSLDQIKALIINPETRALGLQLWQATLQKPAEPFTLSAGQSRFNGNGQVVAAVPNQDKTDTARPLTADEKTAYGLPADGSFEMQNGKVFAVPGTYDPRGGAAARNHVVGDALVNDKGEVLYQKPLTTGTQDPDLVETLARRVYSGDTTALTGLGRGAQGSALLASVQKRAGELAAQYKGQPLPDFAESDILHNRADVIGDQAGARASGTLNARLDTYAKEASGAMDLAVQQSRQVPRTQWTPLNLAVQAVQRGSNDPALAAFVASNNAVINTYAKAINPNGVPTVSDKTHASEVLSTAQSPEAYEATIGQLQREINIAHNAARGARAAERSGDAGKDMAVTSDTGTASGSTSVPAGTAVKNALQFNSTAPVRVSSPEEASKLKSGTSILLPDGRIGTVP